MAVIGQVKSTNYNKDFNDWGSKISVMINLWKIKGFNVGLGGCKISYIHIYGSALFMPTP